MTKKSGLSRALVIRETVAGYLVMLPSLFFFLVFVIFYLFYNGFIILLVYGEYFPAFRAFDPLDLFL